MKKFIGCLVITLSLLCVGPWLPLVHATSAPAITDQAGTRLNVNTASVQELQALPGIGRVTARRIVDYRSAQGPFADQKDLLKVKGIGQSTLEKIRDKIVLK